nr:class I SAM-dependent methyltransferase [Desulfosarcina widdelii]
MQNDARRIVRFSIQEQFRHRAAEGSNSPIRVRLHRKKKSFFMRKFTEGLVDTETIVEALDIQPGQTIIDAGCGTGYMSRIFSRVVTLSGKIYAVDRDSYFIEKLSEETEGGNIEAIQSDIAQLDGLDDRIADLIYAATVIHALSRPQLTAFIKEARRLLKPDARLAIVEIEKKETPFGPAIENRTSPEELVEKVPMVPLKTVRAGDHFYMQVFLNSEK